MNILYAILGILVIFLVLANVIPTLWPMIANTSGNITAMTGTDAGTTTIKAFWPIAILVIGIGIGVAVIMVGIKKFRGLT